MLLTFEAEFYVETSYFAVGLDILPEMTAWKLVDPAQECGGLKALLHFIILRV